MSQIIFPSSSSSPSIWYRDTLVVNNLQQVSLVPSPHVTETKHDQLNVHRQKSTLTFYRYFFDNTNCWSTWAQWKCDRVLRRKLTVSHTAHSVTKQHLVDTLGRREQWGIPTCAPERSLFLCLFVCLCSISQFLFTRRNCVCWVTHACTTLHHFWTLHTERTEHTGRGRSWDDTMQHNEFSRRVNVFYKRQFARRATIHQKCAEGLFYSGFCR